ncbi:hypothetical protein BY458DRAFT_509220 [Sporodiniella umbellata]|nr:hypothetical protein BY458DRAFT_509220 [Sporodiniella umbellata]
MTKKLVILGGGAAGFLIASHINKQKLDLDVVLIDSKSYFEYTPAMCSVLFEKTLEDLRRHFTNVTFDYESVLAGLNVQFICGTVKQVEDTQVQVSVKDTSLFVKYDLIAICTGSSYPGPWKANEECLEWDKRLNYLEKERQAYLDAKDILCIGGGPVGVEVAGEVAYRSPHKSITLINSGPVVLASAPHNLGKKAQRILKAQKVHLIMDEKAEEQNGVYVTNKSHQTLRPSLVYNCIGVKPNTSFLNPDWLDDSGCVKVEKNLSVQGKDNIFALGDVNNIGEPKLYYTAHMQAMHFTHQLSNILQGKYMEPYRFSTPTMFISLGPYYSVGAFSKLSLAGWPLGQDRGSRLASWMKFIIEKVSTQGGGRVEGFVNQTLYLYNRLTC